MLWSSCGGSLESASLEPVRWRGTGLCAGFSSGGVFELAPSNRVAMEAVFEARTVCCVDEETCRVGSGRAGSSRVGEDGGSGAVVIPRVLSHEGALFEALLVVACRSGVCVGVGVPPAGLKGELEGVVGRAFDGEWVAEEF